MTTQTIDPALVALFEAPKPKQPKEAKSEAYRMKLRYAIQDYVAWKKTQPRAAAAINAIFIAAAFDLEPLLKTDDKGKVIIPDTRNIEIPDPDAVRAALEKTNEIKAAFKAAMASFEAGKTPVVDENEYELEKPDVNPAGEPDPEPSDEEIKNAQDVIDPEPQDIVPPVKPTAPFKAKGKGK